MNNLRKVSLSSMLLIANMVVNAQNTIPEGWIVAGSKPDNYVFGVDDKHSNSKGKAAFIMSNLTPEERSAETLGDGFGTLMQRISAEKYKGQRIKMSVFIKTENVASWASAWFRVDAMKEGKNRSVSFDNMRNRQISGNNDWQRYSLVLDVPENASTMNYGVMIQGQGKVWFDELSFETVDLNTAVTDMYAIAQSPTNLSFENE